MAIWRASARLGAVLFWMTAAAWGQESCPEPIGDIEKLPITHKGEISCTMASSLGRYESPNCPNGFDYEGGERVYKVRLNQGNEVSFSLDVQGSADLMLALVKDCGDGKTCVSSSADFIGSDDEEISAAKYSPGVYYLYVDSVKGGCGSYELTVKGTNPTADLKLDLAAPKSVSAGKSLTYTLTVENQGDGEAEVVDLTLALPKGMKLKAGSGCTDNGSTVACSIEKLAVTASAAKKITVDVESDVRGLLKATAEATVRGSLGRPALDAATTQVNGESDLSISMSSSANPVVAGQPLTYTFTLHNAGPSEANQVTVTDTLSGKETFPRASTAWPCETVTADGITTVACKVSKLLVGETVTHSITVNVEPSALEPIINRATVTSNETEPTCKNKSECGPNSDSETTTVKRETDLTIDLTQEPPGEVGAGEEFSYKITIENLKGPSDSSGALVKDCLPDPLIYVQKDSRCEISNEEDDGCAGTLVTCRIGPINFKDRSTLTIGATTAPDLEPTTVFNKAELKANEEGDDKSKNVTTVLKIKADLRVLSKTAEKVSEPGVATESVCVDETFLYKINVINSGPSTSRGGTISDSFPEGLCFVSSPDGCTATDSGGRNVTCPVPLLEDEEEHSVLIAASPCGTKVEIVNSASVESEHDPNPKGESKSATTIILRDLAVTLSSDKSLVRIEELFTYRVGVTNLGPSEAEDIKVRLTLKGAKSDDPRCTLQQEASETECNLDVPDLAKGDTVNLEIVVAAPAQRGNVMAVASLVNPDRCNQDQNTAETTTTVAEEGDVDLALTMTADASTVVAGDLLTYRINVVNQGFANSPAITVTDDIPEGAKLESLLACDTETGACEAESCDTETVTCSLAAPYPTVEVKIKVLPGAQSPFINTATVQASPSDTAPIDPNSDDNKISIETPVLPGRLLLPFFEVGGRLEEVTTLFAVRNLISGQVNVQYDFLDDPVPLAPHETDTVNLRNVSGFAGKTGYVAISPDPPDAPLGGDFVRIDPSRDAASGELLVPAAEMCREWSVRFLNGKPMGSSTDLLFFVPGNGAKEVIGKVYAEDGQFVQKITFIAPQEAFKKTMGDLRLLAGSGSIEWSFPENVVGNVTAIHKLGGKDEVAVPGFCRTLQDVGGRSSLILPFFQVDPNGATTYLAIRNETDKGLKVQIRTFTSAGASPDNQLPELLLAGHGTHTVNLRSTGISEGYVTVEVLEPALGRALSGDYILVDENGDLAGSALVDAVSPKQRCQKWDVRFLRDVPPGSNTSFLFFLEGSEIPTGNAYDESGKHLGEVSVPAPLLRSSLIPLSGLVSDFPNAALGRTGRIEWDLGEGNTGHVAMLFTGDYSMLIPGVCLKTEAPAP